MEEKLRRKNASKELRDALNALRKNHFQNDFELYKKINLITHQIIETYYSEQKRRIIFPIDIRGIVESYGIKVVDTYLNVDVGFKIERVNSRIVYLDDGSCEIKLEYMDSENVRRYMLAHEFGHFLIGDKKNENCVDPLFPKYWEELIADIIATFLLFPCELVLLKMKNYTDNMEKGNIYPIDSADWLRVLGDAAQISSYHTIMSYQWIRTYMCYLYNNHDLFATQKRFESLFK